MTPLIDVIFLLLLFFMLTSTFSKFSEVELTAASGATSASVPPPLFLQLGEARVSLNAQALSLDTLPSAVGALSRGTQEAPQTLLVSMDAGVSAQRLTDVLVALRGAAGLSVAVLGPGP